MVKISSRAILLLFSLFIFGCTPAVLPVAAPGVAIDATGKQAIMRHGDLEIRTHLETLEVAPYRMVDNLSSFYFLIRNHGASPVSVPLSSFYLVDQGGISVTAVEPEKIQGIVQKDSQYLIPYPYVGYYYLEDREKSSFFNTFDSSLPYYASNNPQDIFTYALPQSPVLPGSAIEGSVYFTANLTAKKFFEIRIYLPGTPLASPPDFRFPFSVEN